MAQVRLPPPAYSWVPSEIAHYAGFPGIDPARDSNALFRASISIPRVFAPSWMSSSGTRSDWARAGGAKAPRMVHQSYLAGIPVVKTEGDTITVDSLNVSSCPA